MLAQRRCVGLAVVEVVDEEVLEHGAGAGATGVVVEGVAECLEVAAARRRDEGLAKRLRGGVQGDGQ